MRKRNYIEKLEYIIALAIIIFVGAIIGVFIFRITNSEFIDQKYTDDIDNDRFDLLYSSNIDHTFFVYVIVDRDTDIEYLVTNKANAISVTPLIDNNGSYLRRE